MVKIIANVFRSFNRSQTAQLRRSIHNTNCCSNTLDASPKPQRTRKGTRTKKSYEELPSQRVNTDGTTAIPLAEWWGGEHKSDSPRALLRILRNASETNEGGLTDAGEVDQDTPKPKRRRTSKKVPEDDEFGVERPTRIKKKSTALEVEGEPVTLKLKRATKRKKEAPTLEDEEETKRRPQPTLAQEIQENHIKFPNCILLTRVGQFYESYFEQAVEVASLLNIKLAKRKWGGTNVNMCGFPLQHLDKYLKILVQQNSKFVAMCEEFPTYQAEGKREFERRVVRVITPGTLIDESFLNQYENNYLLSISPPELASTDGDKQLQSVGIAWIDVSTGEFFTKVISSDNIRDEIARIGPKEVVLDQTYQTSPDSTIMDAVAETNTILSFVDISLGPMLSPESATEVPNVTDEITIQQCENHPVHPDVYSPAEGVAIILLTKYLRSNLMEHMPPLLQPNRELTDSRMQIDSHTIEALEIRESMREGGVKGSLMSVIKRTVTNSGTRLLSRWLCSPSTSIEEINARQSLVAFFCKRPHLRSDLHRELSRAEDATRIVQKFLLGRGDPSDLLALSAGINTWSSLTKMVQLEREMEARERTDTHQNEEWASIDSLLSRMAELGTLGMRIGSAILRSEGQPIYKAGLEEDTAAEGENENSVLSFHRHDWRYGRSRFNLSINPEFSEDLRKTNRHIQNLLAQKERLEERLQLLYDAPSLTLRSSPAQGMHIHLGRAKRDQSKLNKDSAFVSLSETGSTKCYFYQEWTQLGSQIFSAALALSEAEKTAFETLRQEITSHASSLRRNARILDELDVTLSFANLAIEMNFVRPTLLDGESYTVVNGRHPTVEMGLLTSGKVFTPNTVQLDSTSKLFVITGPNMAGKSTLLRQTALIAILAQTGSFVPADSAVLGVVDKLFSRVGAKDDLFHDRSTFMVEMLETADILRRATHRSLVIMDEVGRGTTVNDGLAIAFASIHHMLTVNKCRALFATHFHELADMLGIGPKQKGQGVFGNVAFYCTDVDELEDGAFAYSYRLKPGVNRDSHGLKVAQLAGMPDAAVSVAKHVLGALHEQRSQRYDTQQLVSLGQSIAEST